jgi:hypothetical protein
MSSRYFPLPLRMEIHDNGRLATLTAPFVFIEWADQLDPIIKIEVPAGFETDFNSVPRGLWNFFPPWEYPEAGVVHDYLYRLPGPHSRSEADRVHRRILEILGCPWWKRWGAWTALRSFGWVPWKEIPDSGSL